MFERFSQDPLLGSVRVILTGLLGAAILGGGACLVAIPALYSQRSQAGLDLVRTDMPRIAALLILVAVMAALGFFFIRQLRRIVDSVAQGDPFVPLNAARLQNMAWLTVAYQFVQIPMTSLAIWFDAAPQHPNVHHGDDGISVATILLALVLFVLARVFRHGAAMREDLEGTV